MQRVTFRALYANMAQTLSRFNVDLAKLNEQITTGNKINRPSDDPVATVSILSFRRGLTALDQYQRNITQAESWLKTSDSALTNANEIMGRARELAEQMATGSYSAENRKSAATEVDSLIANILNLANTKTGNSHLFAGSKVYTTPFTGQLTITPPIQDPQNAASYCGVVAASGTYYDGHARLDAEFDDLGRRIMLAENVETSRTARLNYDGYFSFYFDHDGDYDGTTPEDADIAGVYRITSAMTLDDIQGLINQGTAARGTLAFSGAPADGDTLTLGGQAYTFGSAAGQVSLGSGLASTMANLVFAVNADSAGYFLALDQGGGSAILVARTPGASGNDLNVSASLADPASGTFNGLALASGANLSGGGVQWVVADLVSQGSAAFRLRLTGDTANVSTGTDHYQVYLGSDGGPLDRFSGAGFSFFSDDYLSAGDWSQATCPLVYFLADKAGSAYNSMSLELRDPGQANSSLTVTVTDWSVVVNLATDATGQVTSTLAQVKAALDAHSKASQMVDTVIPDGLPTDTVAPVLSQVYFSEGRTAQSRRYVVEITTAGAVDGPRAAWLETALSGADNDLRFTAKETGTAGNDIRLKYVAGPAGTSTTTVAHTSVSGYQTFTVTLATNSAGQVTATASQVLAAVNADASAYLSASYWPANASGAGAVEAMTDWSVLSGGADQARFKVSEVFAGQTSRGPADYFAATSEPLQIYDSINSEFQGLAISFTENGTTLQEGDKFYIDAGYYHGDQATLDTRIGSTDTVQHNVTGTDFLGGAGEENNVLDMLYKLKDYLNANDQAGVQEMIVRLNAARAELVDMSASVGARLNRLEVRTNVNADFALTTRTHLSNIEGIDITTAISELNMKQVAYQAALASITRVASLSLVDYL